MSNIFDSTHKKMLINRLQMHQEYTDVNEGKYIIAVHGFLYKMLHPRNVIFFP